MRIAVKSAILGHAVFAVIVPIETGDKTAAAWSIGMTLGANLIQFWAIISVLCVIGGLFVRFLRMVGGVLYCAFALTFAQLAHEWRASGFALVMAVVSLMLAWSGIPDRKEA